MIKMKFVFFLIFYVILGTTGITIPVLISQQFAPNEISIGFITIVMSTIGYNASERIMQLYDSNSRSKKTEMFINLIALVIALLCTIYVCICILKPTTIWVSIIVYVFSCLFWWFQNWNNKNLEKTSASDALGGDNF
ncbi:hypothetical protein C7120_04855 [Prevotella sp. oral taxon 376]|nr:hypothetical protein C7120_04855 [Prevotella sp. oral taxon 376]